MDLREQIVRALRKVATRPDFLHLDCGDEEVQGAVDSSG